MRWINRGIACGLLLLTIGCLHPPVLWSPDGRWLAYTTRVSPSEVLVKSGWLLDGEAKRPRSALIEEGQARRYRLWASRPDTGESILLADSIEPISSPSWSHDGKSLAVARVVAEPEGRKRLEIVLILGPGRERILSSEPVDPFRVELSRLPDIAPAWSPDGSLIAAPRVQPLGLAILRVDNGRVLKAIDDAYLPSWSPDGSRLAFIRRGETESLGVVEPRAGGPRYLHDVGQTDQAPVWSRDGQAVVVAARPSRGKVGKVIAGTDDVILLRMSVEKGQVEPLRPLSGDRPMPGEAAVSGIAFSLDREEDDLFYTVSRPNAPAQVTWYRPRDSFVFRKFPIIDYTITVGALAVAPQGKLLAARVGPVDRLLPPALYDLEKNVTSVLAPDDDARLEWITLLSQAAQQILQSHRLSKAVSKGPALPAPSPLPLPGELDENSEASFRLRRISKIGRAVCQRPEGSEPPSPALNDVLDEARLFFEYLSGDYPSAIETLERLEVREGTPHRNLTLLGLRSQIALASGDFERFNAALDLIRKVEPTKRLVLEESGGVTRLIEQNLDRPIWAIRLEEARRFIDEEDKDKDENEVPELQVMPNPDLRAPGVGVDDPRRSIPRVVPR